MHARYKRIPSHPPPSHSSSISTNWTRWWWWWRHRQLHPHLVNRIRQGSTGQQKLCHSHVTSRGCHMQRGGSPLTRKIMQYSSRWAKGFEINSIQGKAMNGIISSYSYPNGSLLLLQRNSLSCNRVQRDETCQHQHTQLFFNMHHRHSEDQHIIQSLP